MKYNMSLKGGKNERGKIENERNGKYNAIKDFVIINLKTPDSETPYLVQKL